MQYTHQIAKHLREVYFGGNWTCVNFKETLSDVSWQEADTQIATCNSIATLLNHTHYYIVLVTKVLQGEALNGKDEWSFAHPPILSAEDWEKMQTKVWEDAEQFALLMEAFPEDKLSEIFTDEKYGIYYRNLQGIIEHLHYHLGQIVIIKKMIKENFQLK